MAVKQSSGTQTLRVAEYIRKSTDMQQHSLENQNEYIRKYARDHGMRVVRTYTDPAKSGIGLKGRDGLRALIQDVFSEDRDFESVLVYDVSRWGRFQDTDEGAHYEFVCRQAGVPIIYCAEPFTDNSPISSVAKNVKRAMAAEFSRELGEKIKASQLRVARMGYHAAGPIPFGYRRVVIDSHGKTKRILEPSECKRLLSDRIGLGFGPAKEVNTIRRIFRLAANTDCSPREIARRLNREGSRSMRGHLWNERIITRLIRQKVYVGIKFYNQTSQRLGARATPNPQEDWVTQSVRPIVSKELFHAANKKINVRTLERSSEAELIQQLREIGGCAGGVLSNAIVRRATSKSTLSNYHRRFGSTVLLFEDIGFEVNQTHLQRAHRDVRARSLNDELVADAIEAVRAAGLVCTRKGESCADRYARLYIGDRSVSVTCKRLPRRNSTISKRPSLKFALKQVDFALVARARFQGDRIYDYFVFDVAKNRGWRFDTRKGALWAIIKLAHGDDFLAEEAVLDLTRPSLPLRKPISPYTVVYG